MGGKTHGYRQKQRVYVRKNTNQDHPSPPSSSSPSSEHSEDSRNSKTTSREKKYTQRHDFSPSNKGKRTKEGFAPSSPLSSSQNAHNGELTEQESASLETFHAVLVRMEEDLLPESHRIPSRLLESIEGYEKEGHRTNEQTWQLYFAALSEYEKDVNLALSSFEMVCAF